MKKITLFLIALTIGIGLKAQEDVAQKYKAMFTLNFIRYVGWDDAAKQGDFVIGIHKASGVKGQLIKQAAGKKFGYQNIVVKEYKNIDELENCQIFYHGGNFSKDAELVKQKLNKSGSLIITESGNATKSGSMINFVIIDGKLKFEVSETNASNFGLKLSSSLTSLSNAIAK